MDRSGAQSRATNRKREPLGDGTARANAGSPGTPPRPNKIPRAADSPSSTNSNSIPHHESMQPNGSLRVRNSTRTDTSSSRNRLSAASRDEEQYEGKRISQLSASSQASNWSGKKERVGPWILGRDIGRGMVGKVRKVKHYKTGQLAAAKIIPAKQAEAMRAESLMNLAATPGGKYQEQKVLPLGIEREVVIMRLLAHENIVKLYDIWENRGELYLIMELVSDGELFDYVTENRRIEEDETVFIFRQIVAALLSAHRLGIYHRDLKPENILLDIHQDEEFGSPIPIVKLADFGMAALQPKGKLLTTSCGSIHYAAPEVFEKKYDGGKADVWSLGVILYVMLTGMLPFTDVPGENFQVHWYRQIKTGQYAVADWLSPEAQDLIKRMLVPSPRSRISLENVWNHPLLEKWRDAWDETEEERTLFHWIGANPSISKWNIRLERDIEPDLFRNLRVLWHSESEEDLKKRLLSKEVNLEKYFYHALFQHREEQLENFMCGSDTLAYSASDHHHTKPNLDAETLPPLPPTAYKRTKSSLSILHDDAPQPKTGATRKASTTTSERSYDPYRSSRNPIVSDKENFSVTVHRNGSMPKRQPSGTINAKTNSLRVDTLRKQQNRLSAESGSLHSQRACPSPRPNAARRSMSRGSIVSSTYPSSPPGSILVRPSSSHRRGVDFSHVRRSSTTSALSASRSPSRATLSPAARPSVSTRASNSPSKTRSAAPSRTEPQSCSASPSPPVQELMDKIEKAKQRKSKTNSQVIESETRKVSAELGKYCDETFNRDSIGSSYATTTATTRAPSACDTPPSSVSYRGSGGTTHGSGAGVFTPERISTMHSDAFGETPTSFLVSQLAATQRSLAERYANDKLASSNQVYREVMAGLDHLLANQSAALQADSRRVVSAPQPGSGPLPIITEEDRAVTEEPSSLRHSYGRSSTGSTTSRSRADREQQRPVDPTTTIRVIEPSSPAVIPPLNIRKATSPPESPAPRGEPYKVPAFSNSASLRYYNGVEPQQQQSSRRLPQVKPASSLDPISENAAAQAASHRQAGGLTAKRSGWFGGWKREHSADRVATRDASWQRFDSSRRPSRQASAETDLRTQDVSVPAPKAALPGKRPGFLSIFSRKKPSKKPPPKSTLGQLPYTRRRLADDADSHYADDDHNHSQTALSTHSSQSSGEKPRRRFYYNAQATRSRITSQASNEEEVSLGIQRNWLERFFNIKPASQAMCFRAGRGRVRAELVRLLRGWYSYGVRDVVFDREKNLVFARVAADNYLRIKEVAFVIQLFVVLEHDRKANLSVARFIQRKGAASAFRVTVNRIEQVMRKKGYIVEDPIKKREMEEMLVG